MGNENSKKIFEMLDRGKFSIKKLLKLKIKKYL